ncbi:protein windpipe [Plodia interpunctella]|uniref:protein windpipe n=1 Tax=Plodia interpunctella TaxID=58824 RepID=UPI0023682020|nr:protein windpipe [Plodia interpunctella]XP_053613342.1 protein windpipe [Plodia interpunctella]XP_053613349.1 protein windpipe [Plodia interpunctella]
MAELHVTVYVLAVSLLAAPILSAICPDGCVCNTTRDGLHRATCSNLLELYKFTLRQKHHNINILDLSHNNITKLTHELDRLTEVVTLDLSTNGITNLNKFLHNARKLVHLNLANNRIKTLSLTQLPNSVSSLDLTNNLLQDVPSDLGHLTGLEHLELEGNPLHCSCENIMARDRLITSNVYIDKVQCSSPEKLKGRSWLELKTKDLCKIPKVETNYLDMMMGDQPLDAVKIGEDTTALKSMPLVAKSDLDDGNVIHNDGTAEDDDSLVFMKVGHATPSPEKQIEGSGDDESSTNSEFIVSKREHQLHSSVLVNEDMISAQNVHTTEDPIYGSGDGSGSGDGIILLEDDVIEETTETTSTFIPLLSPGPVTRIFEDTFDNTTEFPIPLAPSVYEGGPNWHNKPDVTTVSTESPISTQVMRDTTVSEHIRVTQAPENHGVAPVTSNEIQPHKTGTYVCIAIIVIILVGLIGFAIIKGQMRKRRDRRLLRQQRRDVENASKEMVDMNKSLLGKPAVLESSIEKKVNGKYELVPTHEVIQKKGENGDVGNGVKYNDTNGIRTDSPRDSNQNKSSSKDNNLTEDNQLPKETSFESDLTSPDSRKDTNSLSSEDIFVPIHDDEEVPRLNGNADSDISQPLLNGDQNTDSDFLSPSREYVPVYSPDMGRVRIKMTETPKPKTPVLVTRSRSNAGDIIVTPSGDGNARKSTT